MPLRLESRFPVEYGDQPLELGDLRGEHFLPEPGLPQGVQLLDGLSSRFVYINVQ